MTSDVPFRRPRDWRVIAQELAVEHDSRRVLELSRELSAAIEPRAFNDGDHRETHSNGHSPEVHSNNGTDPYARLQNSAHTAALLKSAIEASAADFGNVQLFDPASRALRIVAQSGFGEEFLSYYATVRLEDECACAAAMRHQSRTTISNVATDPVFGLESRNVLLRANVRSVQSTPLVSASGKLIGMLNTHYRRVDGPTPLVWTPLDDLAAAFVNEVDVPETS